MTYEESTSLPSEWPNCKPDQVRVMLLGTYHMDNPGLDEVNVDADNVLSDHRQTELRNLVNRLADWNPDTVAVERPYDRSEEVNERYEEYRSGKRAYDREERFPASHPIRNELDTECRSEVVQVGFRLASHLNHDRVAVIDEHPEKSRYDPDPFEKREIDSTRKTSITLPDAGTIQREADERLASSTIPEYFAQINSEGQLRHNHDMMFDQGVRAREEPFESPLALAYWYDRNIRMVHHLWRTMSSDTQRILLLVGSGHIRVLRHLLDEAPMFCPVSPLPYLPDYV